MGTRASSAVPLSYINSAMEVQALNAAPVNNGMGACALRAPPRHASRGNIATVTARRLFRLKHLYPPFPDRAVAVSFEVWDGRSSNKVSSPRDGGRFKVWEGQH